MLTTDGKGIDFYKKIGFVRAGETEFMWIYKGNDIKRYKNMIARIWHGRTKKEDYEEYTDLMKSKAIPDYKSTEGFIDLAFLRRLDNDIAHFTLITFWENMEVIKNFAGEDFEKAKYYTEDEKFLLEFEERVIHHEVFAK